MTKLKQQEQYDQRQKEKKKEYKDHKNGFKEEFRRRVNQLMLFFLLNSIFSLLFLYHEQSHLIHYQILIDALPFEIIISSFLFCQRKKNEKIREEKHWKQIKKKII